MRMENICTLIDAGMKGDDFDTERVSFRLKGGLGNQFFQWAAAVAFHRQTELPVAIIPPSPPPILSRCRRLLQKGIWTHHAEISLKAYFNVCTIPGVAWASPKLADDWTGDRFAPRREELLPGYWTEVYDSQLFSVPVGTCVEGWLQDIRYFRSVVSELSLLCSEQRDTRCQVERIEASLGASLRDCCAIHVRRGDYWTIRDKLSHPQRGWVLPRSYYEHACDALRVDDFAVVLLISDASPDELCDEFSFLKRRVALQSRSAAVDFALLAQAGACVLANSTFSWWAGMLNTTARGSIAAPQFFLGWWQKVWIPVGLRVDGWQWINVD